MLFFRRCRFEKQARLKKYDQSPKEKPNENKKPITIPLPVSDQPKVNQTPVQIPVRHTSISSKFHLFSLDKFESIILDDNYSEDFDGSDKQKHSTRDDYSTDSSVKRSQTNERKSKAKDLAPKVFD